MPVITYTVACLSKKLIAKDVYEFALAKPPGLTFKPGQFVLFDVPLIENPADIQTRAFSIASAPHEDDLLFVAKLVPGGRASRWIAEELKKGLPVIMKGPFGNFLLDRETPHEYLFIATSTGIAPFRSMILSALALTPGRAEPALSRTEGLAAPLPQAGEGGRRMDIIFGAKTEEDIFWVSEMESISQKYGNVFMHFALSDPSPAWTGHRGWVQALAPKIVKDFSQKSLYVCGNPAMTKDVKQLALGEWGMDKKMVHVEGYI